MEEIKYEVMDDLKYKLRNKVDERNAVSSSIVPMKDFIVQFGLSYILVGMFLFGVSALTLATSGIATVPTALGISAAAIGGISLFVFPLAISTHKEDIELKKKILSQKELEVSELISIIKELEKKNKIIDKQNDLLLEKDGKKIIREEDFLDYYLDNIKSETEDKPKQLVK